MVENNNQKDWKSTKLRVKTYDKLVAMKIHPRQSISEVIDELIKCNWTEEQEEIYIKKLEKELGMEHGVKSKIRKVILK